MHMNVFKTEVLFRVKRCGEKILVEDYEERIL